METFSFVGMVACELAFAWMVESSLDEAGVVVRSEGVVIVEEEEEEVMSFLVVGFSHVFHHTYHLLEEQVKLVLFVPGSDV